jgi:hypothetical protein
VDHQILPDGRVIRSWIVMASLGCLVILYGGFDYVLKGVIQHNLQQNWDKRYREANSDLVEFVSIKGEPEKFEIEDDREIIYKGGYYDIVKVDERGDSTIYHCWYDHEESGLVSHTNREDQENREILLKKNIDYLFPVLSWSDQELPDLQSDFPYQSILPQTSLREILQPPEQLDE